MTDPISLGVTLILKPVATKFCLALGQQGWEAALNKSRGTAEERALARVLSSAFDHLLIANRAAGLQIAEQELIRDMLRDFTRHEDVMQQLIELADDDQPPPIEELARRFDFYSGDLDGFPHGFQHSITKLIEGLRVGLIKEAQDNSSPLHGKVVVMTGVMTLKEMREFRQEMRHFLSQKANSETSPLQALADHKPDNVVPSFNAMIVPEPPASPGVSVNDLHDAITRAAQPTLEGDPQAAIGRLTQLREERWEELDAYGRYRLLANLGNAYERRRDETRAAEYYLEASAFQPENADAQAFRALALLHQDRLSEAFVLADTLLHRYPYHGRLHAIRVRTAPGDQSNDDVEQNVPASLRTQPEIAAALAQRALDAHDLVHAERHARAALAAEPDWDGAQAVLATILLVQAQEAWNTNFGEVLPAEQVTRVEEAVGLLTATLTKLQPVAIPSSLVHLLMNRSLAHRFLGSNLEAGQDIMFASRLAPNDPDVVLRLGAWLWDQGEKDQAIAHFASPMTPQVPEMTIVLGKWRFIRHQGTDLADAARDLEALLGTLDPCDAELLPDAISLLVAVYLADKNVNQARNTLSLPLAERLAPLRRALLKADVALLDDRRGEAESLIRDALATLGDDAEQSDRLRLAYLVEELHWWRQALALWQTLATPGILTTATRHLLHCAEEAGEDNTALITCRELREHGIWDTQCFDNELALLEQYHALPQALALMEEYLHEPSDENLATHIRIRLALLALRTGQENVVRRLIPQLPPVGMVELRQGRAVVEVLRFSDDPIRAIQYAYDLWKRFSDQPEAFDAIIASFILFDKPLEISPTIGPDCAVGLKASGEEETEWWILEDAPNPRQNYREIALATPLAQALLGKSAGDEVTLPGNPFFPRVMRIVEITPKVVYRWLWCLAEQSRHFPDQAYVQMIKLPTSPSGELDPTQLFRMAEERALMRQELNELYRRGPLPIAAYAAMANQPIIHAMDYLISEPTLLIYSGAIDGQTLLSAYAGVRKSEALVVDVTALLTLSALGEEAVLTSIPVPLFVSAGTIELLRAYLQQLSTERQAIGGLIWTQSGPAFLPHSPELRQQQIDRIQRLLDTVTACCQIEAGIALAALAPAIRDKMIKVCGQQSAESIAVAMQPGRMLWVDDIWIGQIAKLTCSVESAWTHAILNTYRDMGAFDKVWVARTSARLQAAGYTGIILTPQDIIQALIDGEWLFTNPLVARAIDSLSTPLLSDEGAALYAIQVLKPIWQDAPSTGHSEALTWHLLGQLGQRSDSEVVVRVIQRTVNRLFGLDVVHAHYLETLIKVWRGATQRERLVVLPPRKLIDASKLGPQIALPE